MIHRHERARPSRTGTSERSPICRLRFIPALLLGLLFLSAGCAKQAPPPRVPEKPVVVVQSTDVVDVARKNIGIPYKFGGTSPQTGFDCSGLVCWVYAEVGVKLPRTARDQFNYGERVQKNELKPGDIVLFKGTRSRTGWHSGIYTGEGKFIHSPNKGKTVMESSLDEKYFAQRFVGASRIPRDGSADVLYAAYQAEQRDLANKRRAAKPAASKKTLVADSGKKGGKPAARAAKPAKGKKTTPLRAAAAASKTSDPKQAAAVVDKLNAAKKQAPAARTQARSSRARSGG